MVGTGVVEGVLLLMKGDALVLDTIASCKRSLVGLCLSCSDQSVKLLVHDVHPWIDVGEKASNGAG